MDGREFDIVMATDLRFPGGTTASVAEEVEAQYRAGYRTGLLHIPSPIQRSRRPFADRIRRLLDDGKAELIAGPRPVRTPLLLIRHPSVLSDPAVHIPPVEAEHVLMIANQVPQDERGAQEYFDAAQVHRNIRTVFGRDAVWAPIGPAVRTALAPSGVPMREGNWENIIDVEAWYTKRVGFVSDRPVIGRHSRGHWSKWPATRQELLAAYPGNPNYEVRIMGGTEAPIGLLGELPPNWTSLPFDAIPVPKFLAGIDFFVYFHHPGLVEAFGRVVLEALAAGAVCVVPAAFEPIFEEACHYGAPADVQGFVDRMYADPQEFLRRSRAGQELVRARFSYQAHLDRIAPFLGTPLNDMKPAPSFQAPEHPSILVTTGLITVGHPEIDGEAQRSLSDSCGPLVVLTSQDRADWAGEALIETVPDVVQRQSGDARRNDLRRRLKHLVRAHDAKRVLLLDADGVSLTGELATDVQVEVLTPSQEGVDWTSRPADRPAQDRASPRAVLQRFSRQAESLARRRAPRLVRRAGRHVVDAGDRLQRGIAGYASVQNPTVIPVSRIYPHLHPRLPVALLAVTSTKVDPSTTLDAALARAQEASAFRLAFLAPTNWTEAARRRGVTLETWITDDEWPATYTARWPEYARDRLTHVARLTRPATVVNIDQTIEVGDSDSTRVLDLIEAAANART